MNTVQSTTEANVPTLLVRRELQINSRSLIFAHPLAAAAFGSVVFLFAWTFPPSLYTDLVGDDCQTFLDPIIILFNALCLGALVAGLYVGSSGSILRITLPKEATPDFLRCPFTIQSLLVVLILANTSAFVLFGKRAGFSVVLAALRGSQSYLYELKKTTGGDIEEPWKLLLLISAVSIPAAWHFARSYGKNTWTWWLFWIGVATYIPAALLTAKRNLLILPLFGVLLSHLVWTKQGRQNSMLRSAGTIVGTGIVMVVLFLALASVRNGVDGIEEGAGEIVRYVVGPYNTETLIVNEDLSFPGERKGYLWTHWFWTFPVVANVLNFDELRDELVGSRVAIGVGERRPFLNKQFGISATTGIPAFGCAFIDFGWFGAIPFFLVGVFGAVFWKMFLAQRVTGLLFYPLIAYSFTQWHSNLIFPSTRSNVCILVCLTTVICLSVELSLSRKSR